MKDRKKLVLFDHQIFAIQTFGGVSRQFVERMKRTDPELWDLCLTFSNSVYLKELGKKIPHLNFFKSRSFRGKERLMLELGKPYSLYKAAKGDYGVLHLTHYESYACGAVKRPVVVTYHDKTWSTYYYNKRVVEEQRKVFARADKIITVSDYTKSDLISLFNIDEKKAVTIYPGTSENPYPRNERIIKDKYILYVGWRSNYKNFPRLLEAFARILRKEMPELKLVCTGVPFDNEERRMINALGIEEDRMSSQFYSEEDMQNLYQNAELFVFPSEHEGFGLPLLEAMKNDCPVVCSNATCFPEIAGDAAEYFNALDADDLFETLKRTLSSDETRKRLVEKGKIRYKKFTWEKSAREHIDLYKSLI